MAEIINAAAARLTQLPAVSGAIFEERGSRVVVRSTHLVVDAPLIAAATGVLAATTSLHPEIDGPPVLGAAQRSSRVTGGDARLLVPASDPAALPRAAPAVGTPALVEGGTIADLAGGARSPGSEGCALAPHY